MGNREAEPTSSPQEEMAWPVAQAADDVPAGKIATWGQGVIPSDQA
ncbi:MAG: hypothetical protein IPL01_06000 [Acidobacteria bacterium]|nr:hypothetical protein [Acidobacteriota bacterium]